MVLLLVPPAQVVQAPAGPPALAEAQGSFEAVARALVEGRRGAMRGLIAQGKAAWERAKPGLGKTLSAAEVTAFDRQVKAMGTMKPREQAVGALGLANTLAGRQAKSADQDVRQAERMAMMAWCAVDDGQWNLIPGVDAPFKPVVALYPAAGPGLEASLARFREAQQKRQPAAAKKALKEVLDQSARLGKG
ncbi:hypothetical protein [Geothrix sp. 21YS21S-4]|uniref:hypothetical protein n=1 Tax=Geothrix sp. 21YS21S-4 TaxID=3068889 RepID=UPI0027BA8F09|nr:hypothetical protein [Geothrix sp. 21YS21S-4]